jgi:hypothetical protein
MQSAPKACAVLVLGTFVPYTMEPEYVVSNSSTPAFCIRTRLAASMHVVRPSVVGEQLLAHADVQLLPHVSVGNPGA